MPPSEATSQYPLPSGVPAIPTGGALTATAAEAAAGSASMSAVAGTASASRAAAVRAARRILPLVVSPNRVGDAVYSRRAFVRDLFISSPLSHRYFSFRRNGFPARELTLNVLLFTGANTWSPSRSGRFRLRR